ncbi:2Fe-2S iron-sulfur cluster-binding protein [Candidatus Hydrogenosomobacter endosymbioticus]|uniref:2Fe-2S ferredoxin-type domain-containing protein n=1 Tax=Candidatus Hydrogenosomobacter endosymbioticus TaxID=2558174 RepID=A0ABM7V8L0_9PROT|nr:2Fe-2S iron-sulfur cluster-binding protein [Candidatus Hydrogenosomobacter endosymbioticus]BDB96118.1 hypothetical protein HYD_2510 [Candidatus Hydrogenosomobacter endosymbioticus]
MPKVKFVYGCGEVVVVDAFVGESLLDAAERCGVSLSGPCGGVLACGMCGVTISPEFFHKIKPASDDEEDLLACTQSCEQTARLACQVIVTEDMDGIEVKIPGKRCCCG